MGNNGIRRIFRRQKNKVKDHDSIIDTEIQNLNRASKNPSGQRAYYNKQRLAEYVAFLQDLDLQQNCALFEYEIEEYKSAKWQIPRMLYFHGALCWFRLKNGVIAYAPVAFLTWLYNGMPLECKPVPVMGSPLVDYEHPYLIGINAVIQYDSVPAFQSGLPTPRAKKVQILVEFMAETFARLNINMTLAGDKLFIQCENTESADAILSFLEESFGVQSPFVVTSKQLMAEPLTQTFETKFDDLTSLLKEIDTWRQLLNGMGSGNYGVHKKERMITDEMSQNEDSPNLVMEMREQMLLEWIANMKEVFGIEVKYTKREQKTDDTRRDTGTGSGSSEDSPSPAGGSNEGTDN